MNKLLKITTVQERCALSKATIYKMIAKGEFPRQRKQLTNSVGWLESEVDSWITSRICR